MRMFLTLVLIMMSSAFVMAQGKYGFKVAGVDVTKKNCKDLTEISGVSGKVYFDPSTKTLTLDNATIEANDCNAIKNETCDYLSIELIGTNSINVTGVASGINLKEETTIWSHCGGKLSVKSEKCAVFFRDCPLEISNCWLEAEGAWGISANNKVAEEVLKISNSHVEATGPNGSISDIAGLELEGCYIDIPSKAAYNADTKSVAVNGVTVTDKVVIESDSYGIQIAGVDVTKKNCKDLSEISGVSGKVYFDPNTRTLTLDNATIEADGCNAILNETCDYLSIELIGTNTINVTGMVSSITLEESTTIWSHCGGKLSVKSEKCAVYFPGCPLEISNCWLELEGYWGISADGKVAEEVLTIRNSHVEATGPKGSICDLQNLVLDGCSITQPTGAAFDANVHAVALNGEAVTDKVVIESDNNSIGTITVDVPARKQGIYNLNGVKLTQQWDDLPAGIYIVDGVKRVKN